MRGAGLVVVALITSLLVGVVVGPAAAQAGDDPDGESEGGLEGAIRGLVAGQGLPGALLVLAGGMLLLTASTEKLISYLTRASLRLRISLFALAILFTGFEFDDTVLALVLAAGDLEGAALGTALGTGLAIVGVTLAIAAALGPVPVDLPTDYVVLFAAAPLPLIPLAAGGTLTLVHGLVLIGLFVLMFVYLVLREHQREIPVFRNTELGRAIQPDGGVVLPKAVAGIPEDRLVGGRPRAGWAWLGLSVVALGGVVLASMLLETGSEVVIEGFGIEGTVFGATVLTLILTSEDLLLTIEPVRRGVPEIGIGNVIGSVLFSVTANVGVVLLLGDLRIAPSVLGFHLPAIVLLTALAAYFLHTGGLERWHGYVLGGLYAAYWIVAVVVFGGVPVSG